MYFVYVFASTLGIGARVQIYNFLPHYAVERNFSKDKVAILLSVMAIADACVRLPTGAMVDIKLVKTFVSKKTVHGVAFLIFGTSTLFLPMISSFDMLLVYCSVAGVAIGISSSLYSLCVAESVPRERLSVAMGYSVTCVCVMLTVFPVLLGK